MKTQPGDEYMQSLFPKLISDLRGIAIYLMNKEGIITSWNQGCEQLKGYKADEALGHNYEMLFPEDLRSQQMPEKELKETEKSGRYETVNRRRKKYGEIFWAHVILTKVTDEQGNFVGFAKITSDVTETKHYQEDLEKQNEQLETSNEELKKINRDLDSFVYTASHDLKAPINNMQGLLTALEDKMTEELKKDPETGSVLEMMKVSCDKLQANIKDMALSAKMESEKKGYTQQAFEEIIEDIQYSLADEIKKSEAKFHLHLEEPKINYSRKNVRTILYNLISNSIKYRPPERKPVVTITTRRISQYTLICVADNGLGIKQEDKKNVFAMYERLNPEIEGTGVGMSIVARIVNSNGGKIEIESEKGQGTTFKVFLKESGGEG